ncbi:MAG: HEAT repeat domain-containing protein [Chloroflexota bacterium]
MSPQSSYKNVHRRLAEERRKDSRTTEELIKLALLPDEDVSSDALAALWYRPPETMLEIARQLSTSHDDGERILAARILGQGGIPVPERFPFDSTLPRLLSMVERETDPEVLSVICVALGNVNDDIGDPQAIEALLRLKNHPDKEVRLAVVQALLFQSGKPAVDALVELSNDQDRDVRDWATFGLAQVEDVDTPAVRDVLWARANDDDPDIRGEALVGLAKRADVGVIELLLQELDEVHSDVGSVLFEAAVEAGKRLYDLRLCQALSYLQTLNSHFGYDDDLRQALDRCKSKQTGQTPE